MQQRRKRHHSVPQGHLARFANSNGMIWQYSRIRPTPIEVSPKNAAVEKYLYAPEVGEDPTDDAFEIFLDQFGDGPGHRLMTKILEGESLNPEERLHFGFYIAMQEYRTPAMRDRMMKIATRMGELVFRKVLSHPHTIRESMRQKGSTISDDDFEKIEQAAKEGKIRVEATKMPWLDSASILEEMALLISSLPWTIIEAPQDFEFVITDNPIVKVLTNRTVAQHYAGGWLSPSAETTFALSPTHALIIKANGIEECITGNIDWCRDVNRRSIRECHRFVFSRQREDYITELFLQKNTKKVVS